MIFRTRKEKSAIQVGLWLSLIFLIVLSVLTGSSAFPQDEKVYVTKTGSKYHRESCRYLKYSRKIISLDSAIVEGYQACKVCKPIQRENQSGEKDSQVNQPRKIPLRALSTAVRCSANKLDGIQCKRMTKNASGKCWQHEK